MFPVLVRVNESYEVIKEKFNFPYFSFLMKKFCAMKNSESTYTLQYCTVLAEEKS